MSNVEVLNIDENNNKNGKVYIIIGIFIIILLFGIGLFLFLRFAKNQRKLNLKKDIAELGQPLNKDVRHYLDGNPKDCKINLEKVDINKIGKYEYTVECKDINATSTIEVKDTKAPTMNLKILNVKPSQKFEATDFVISSTDLSDYTITFENQVYNKYQVGMSLVPIIAKDIYGNVNKQQGVLIVSDVLSEKYLVASKQLQTNYNATVNIIDKIGINYVNFFNNAVRIYEYVFNSENDYKKALDEYNENNNIENNSGQIITIESEKVIKLVKYLEHDDLNDLNGSFPYTYNDISALYNKLGYATTIEK